MSRLDPAPIQNIPARRSAATRGMVGLPYKDLLTEPKPREVVTIYEVDATGRNVIGESGIQFQMDAADGSIRCVHKTIDYPGVRSTTALFQETMASMFCIPIPAALVRDRTGTQKVTFRFRFRRAYNRPRHHIADRKGPMYYPSVRLDVPAVTLATRMPRSVPELCVLQRSKWLNGTFHTSYLYRAIVLTRA